MGHCKNEGKEENFFGFYKWRESTNIFLDLQDMFPDCVRVQRYEDLVDNPIGVAESLFDFVDLPFGDQTIQFIERSNERHVEDPYSVYRDKTVKDKWKDKLDTRIVKGVEQELKGTKLEVFLR